MDGARTTCWHCKERPAEPARAQNVKLHKGRAEQTVEVPICAHCADVLSRRSFVGCLVTFLGVVLGSALLITMIALGVPDTDLGETIMVFTFIGVIGGAFAAPFLARAWVTRKAGYHRPPTHPDVLALTTTGWSLGPVPPEPRPPVSVTKTCGSCGHVVPVASHAGQSCPRCGAYWSLESEKRS